MTRARVDKTHPKSLVAFIMEAIDEVATGQGERVYWLAFERYQECVAREKREAAAKELRASMLRKEEQWTVDEPTAARGVDR
jgi:hypothetical protein